ncbi:hypothetical protein L208DRAFT_1385314 [Tricholoma matsutake]|nr:hypothetical protein L208DRAFT_1385314 [Tricholoma matsutake 945]
MSSPAFSILPTTAVTLLPSPSGSAVTEVEQNRFKSSPTADSPTPTGSDQHIQLKVSKVIGDRWKDSDRRKLSQEGYRTLAILATFMAAVQAPLLSSSSIHGESISSEFVTMLFVWGLMADLFGAVLNYGSARWFEMLTTDEAKYLQEIWVAAETGRELKLPDRDPTFVEEWLSLSVKMGYYSAILGLVFLLSGLLVAVWTQWHLRLVFKVILTIVCAFFAALIPPFGFKHDRKATLYLVKLKRRSG